MIRIFIKEKNNLIKQIKIKGHAGYDTYGKDIVCASVSSIYLCTVNACYKIDDKSILIEDKKDTQIINVNKDNQIISILLTNMIDCLISLEKQYPKNIKIDKEEE